MRFGVLGPLLVEREGHSVCVPAGRQRALLIALLLRAGKVVSAERLIDDVWAASPPADPAHALQQTVFRLRSALQGLGASEEWLVWHSAGYALRIDPEAVDLTQFEQLAALGHRQLDAGDSGAAADTLRRALGLWRGPALCDVTDLPFGRAAAVRLEERRLAATEDRIEADLLCGQQAAVLVELTGLVAEHPFRERLCGQLMRSLYAGGRQGEALDLYQSARRMLADQLGVDPGPQLRRIHQQILVHDPELTAPPERSYRPSVGRRSNLPAPLTSFFGRDGDVGRVMALLETARLLTLTGPGGVGKTRLALRAAEQLVGTTVDGVWWVDLTSLGESTLLADAIQSALEDQPRGRLAPPRARETQPEDRLRSFLADRQLLLVLDNCEHLAAAVGRLAAVILAGAPGVRILATSQWALNTAGEVVWSVPPLPVPSSDAVLSTDALLSYSVVRLFEDRAAAAGGIGTTTDDAEAVAEICRMLDGVPLAIELAAARTRLLPPRQLLARLNHRFELLTTRSATAPARQRTLLAVVEWSYHLLTRAEQLLLRRLAVFVGGARLDAIEQVCAGDGPTRDSDEIRIACLIDLLAGLVDKSLIMVVAAEGEARYTMLETIRAYAKEQSVDAGELTNLRTAHARHYAALAAASVPELHGPDQLCWLRRLAAERANMRAAIEHFNGDGDGAAALRLAAALSQFWWLTGDVIDSRRLTTLALRAAGPSPSPDRAAALTFIAWLDLHEETTPERIAVAEEAADYYHSIGDHDAAALPTALLAMGLRRQGQLRRSRELVAPATGAAGWATAVAQMLSAGTAAWDGDSNRAEQQLTTALDCFRALGDRWGQAECLYLLGGQAHIRGRYDQALQALEEGSDLATQLGNTEQIIKMLAIAGNILVLSGDYPGARARHEEALRLAQQLGLQAEIAFISNGLGLCARRQGDFSRARAHHEQALAFYQRGRWQSGVALTHAWLGYASELEGDADQAEAHHLQSLDVARETGDPRAVALPLEGLAGVAVLRGEYHRCAALLGAATAIRASVGVALPPSERIDVDRAVSGARDQLDSSVFDVEFEHGATMTMDAACTYARSSDPPSTINETRGPSLRGAIGRPN